MPMLSTICSSSFRYCDLKHAKKNIIHLEFKDPDEMYSVIRSYEHSDLLTNILPTIAFLSGMESVEILKATELRDDGRQFPSCKTLPTSKFCI